MKSSILFFCFFCLAYSGLSAQKIEDWLGAWKGELDLGMSALPLIINLEYSDNQWKGTLDSPLQGAFGIKIDSIYIAADKIFFQIKSIYGTYNGKYTDQGIQGTWNQGNEAALNFKKYEVPAEKEKIVIKQEYPVKPYPYLEEEVKISNKKAKVTLAGTLTYPNNKDKFPVAILIAGSGAQDRDSEILGHRPFLLIADYLTRNGMAVLRMDERGVGASTGSQKTATTADFATDIAAAVTFLKKHPRINKKAIGLIGHSEGGIIAPMVASKDKSIAFVILLAAPGVPSKEILAEQFRVSLEPNIGAKNATDLSIFMSKLYNLIEADIKNTKNAAAFATELMPELDKLDNELKDILQLNAASLELMINNIISIPWMRYFIKINPKVYLEKLTCSTYVLQGGKDIQVLPESNLQAIQNALEKANNKNFSVQLYSPLNHLFQTCDYCTIAEYATLQEGFSQEVLEDMAIWLKYNVINTKK